MNKPQVFVVTGAGNGIGREVALLLLQQGFAVAALDISSQGLAETKTLANANNNLKTYVVDITNKEAISNVKEEIMAYFKKVTGLIHVAGIIQPFVKIIDLDYSAMEKVLNVNLWGTIYLNKIFLPALLQENIAYLVNVSSMGGFVPVPGQAVYGASKSAVKLFTEALYAELATTNVAVSVVFPGAIHTNITGNSNVKIDVTADDSKHKMMSPQKAAAEIVRGMFRKKLYIYVGKDVKALKHLYRIGPKATTDLIRKKMGDLVK